jgi:outer membrane protein assembly factor BamB
LKTGTTNWINEINSILTPIIVDDFIFTVSNSGHLFTLQNKQGNIIKINNLYKNYDQKNRKKIKPTGFTIGKNLLYLSNNDGNLFVIELTSGNILKVEKISRGFISKPFIHNKKLFVVKNGSIIKYN